MSRYLEIDNPNYCPNAKFLYNENGVAVTRICEKLWREQGEIKSCNSSQFPDYCLLKVIE